ncbi:serine/threonine-protein kinase [Luteolibacter soli]|uniref:Serine/threonine-protein kinase n=1 Tax=Luteolibacter soli TaxID=3135280 RepID=A0ABU9AWB7_9BACT
MKGNPTAMEVRNPIACPKCGRPLPGDAPLGLCPGCLGQMNLCADTLADDDDVRAGPSIPPEDLAPHFPQLEIIECLGRGGMGVVYKARQKTLNRLVALKLLSPEREKDAEFAARFTREAQALARLSHPHIVTVHDFGHTGNFFFLLMEYVDGVNLRQALGAGRFTPEVALALVPPVCDALQYAHDRGIVHRDIKPENLLLDREGHVKIADFGIAKMLDVHPGNFAEPEGQTVGTPHYMAPEQRDTPLAADHRADIFSLGVVLYEMLTGELPGPQLLAPSRKAAVDVRLDEIVMRALESSPEQRWQTAGEMRTRIETLAVYAPPSAAAEMKQSPGSGDRAKRLLWFVAALLAAAFLGRWLLEILMILKSGGGFHPFQDPRGGFRLAEVALLFALVVFAWFTRRRDLESPYLHIMKNLSLSIVGSSLLVLVGGFTLGRYTQGSASDIAAGKSPVTKNISKRDTSGAAVAQAEDSTRHRRRPASAGASPGRESRGAKEAWENLAQGPERTAAVTGKATTLLNEKNPARRLQLFAEFIEKFETFDFEAIAASFAEHDQQGRLFPQEYDLFLSTAATLGGEEAMNKIFKPGDPLDHSPFGAQHSAMTAFATEDPQKATEWWNAMPESVVKNELARSLISGIAAKDSDHAWVSLDVFPQEERAQFMGDLVRQKISDQGAESAAQWLQGLKSQDGGDVANLKQAGFDSLLNAIVNLSPDKKSQYIDRFSDEPWMQASGFPARVARQWAQQNGTEAVNWAVGLPEAARSRTLLDAFDGWQQSDASGFQAWRTEHQSEDAFRDSIRALDEYSRAQNTH